MKKNIQSLKSYILKEDYDFNRSDISLHNFHPQIFTTNAMMGIFYSDRDSYVRFIWPAFSVMMTFLGLFLEALVVYKSINYDDDYSLAIECSCYIILLGSIPVIYYGSLKNKKAIINLLDSINDDFVYICSMNTKHREQFLQRQLFIWKACYSWLIFSVVTAILFVSFPLVVMLYQLLFNGQLSSPRPLVFPMWLPHDDVYRTPIYEGFLIIETIFCFLFLQTFCGYIYILFHYLLHYNSLMDMIILDFEILFDGLDESVVRLAERDERRLKVKYILKTRIKRIVTWHVSVLNALSTISSIFGPPLVYQVMFSSFAICLMAYQIVKVFEEGSFEILLTALFMGAILQLWIPCYLGTILRNKGFAVAEAAWNCGWHNTSLGLFVRQDIIIIILRAQVPIYIKFTGLPNVQLETFSTLTSKAYSYFNMLRQADIGA